MILPSVFNLKNIAINFHPGDTNRRPVVFVHGNSQNDSCGYGLMEYFVTKGHSFLSYDLPGHGDSPLEVEDYVWDDLVNLNQQLLTEYNIKSPILCGHSIGGMIQAATISQYHINDASLVLCGSYDRNPVAAARSQGQIEIAETIETGLAQYLDEAVKLFRQQKKYNYFENRLVEDMIFDIFNRRYSSPAAVLNNMKCLTHFGVRQELIEKNIPVLVLHGQNEGVIPKALIVEMAKHYNNMKIGWYPDKGHHAFLQMSELTNTYLDQHYQFIAA